MKIKIMCSKCKLDSLLIANEVLNMEEAYNLIQDISEVIERHREHADYLDFYVFDAKEDEKTQRYVFEGIRRKIDGKIHF